MENAFTFDALNAMFDDMKSAYAVKKDDIGIVEKFIESLQQYIADKGKDFNKIANRFFEFLLAEPAIFPGIHKSLIALFATFEKVTEANGNIPVPTPEAAISAYNIGACYEKMGNNQLAEKYYKEAIDLAPADIF